MIGSGCRALLALALLLGASCGNTAATDAGTTTMTSSPIVAGTPPPTTLAKSVEPARDTAVDSSPAHTVVDVSPAVLAAAVLHRAAVANSFSDPAQFTDLYVVERLGHADSHGFVSITDEDPVLTDSQRAAIETALAPRNVSWVASADTIRKTGASSTIPEHHAIISIAEPIIDQGRAEIATELWCGWMCAVGSTTVLERSASGTWRVTGEIGGFIS